MIKRESIQLTEEECKWMIYEEWLPEDMNQDQSPPKFEIERVEEKHRFDGEKGSVNCDMIFSRILDNKLFKLQYTRWGAGDLEIDTTLLEVFPKTIETIIYE